tara:strand:+ start:381 stop:647 length:267 start_codon:yes stop_codon:yes gene_type:complete
MGAQYKENKFSTETLSASHARSQDNMHKTAMLNIDKTEGPNIDRTARPNIDHLIKRVLSERRRERKNFITLGAIFLSIILFFIFFNTN